MKGSYVGGLRPCEREVNRFVRLDRALGSRLQMPTRCNNDIRRKAIRGEHHRAFARAFGVDAVSASPYALIFASVRVPANVGVVESGAESPRFVDRQVPEFFAEGPLVERGVAGFEKADQPVAAQRRDVKRGVRDDVRMRVQEASVAPYRFRANVVTGDDVGEESRAAK